MAKYFIAATPKVYTGGYEEWSRVYHSIFWNSAMASSTFLSSASVCWSWGWNKGEGVWVVRTQAQERTQMPAAGHSPE